MRVTEIEVHEITLEYHDWIAYELSHYYGGQRRTVYVVHTDNGLVGLGESGTSEPESTLERYLGSNPFDWMGDETSLALGTAMYDLIGKAVGVPVYKLFGQKHRSWVPVGSWTVSTHPSRMAQAVKQYSARGYTWLKFHLSPFENVLDQTEAMQAVAPPGFKIHYDFTMHGTSDHMPHLLDKLDQYAVAGCFEDPLPSNDIEGHIELRKRCRLPIVLHHMPLGASHEVLMRAADAYMLGHSTIGDAVRCAGVFAAGNIPFMLQNVGGNITRAMTTHMMAAFSSARLHFHSDTETWKSDVVNERLDPVNGFLHVPERPGLGVTLNRAELERLEKLESPRPSQWIMKSSYKNGTRMYALIDPQHSIFLVRPDRSRIVELSYDAPISSQCWDNDGSKEYQAMLTRLKQEAIIIENQASEQ